MNARAIKKEFGDRIAMWGTVGNAWLCTNGTPDQIREEVRTRIETLGPEGLLLAPAYDLNYVPAEKSLLFLRQQTNGDDCLRIENSPFGLIGQNDFLPYCF